MGKRRKRKPARPVEITTRLPKWGATKQAANAFAEIRALKNRLAEVESTRSVAKVAIEDTSWQPTGTEIEALGKVLTIPVVDAHRLGIVTDLGALAALHVRLVAWNRDRLKSVTWAIRRAGGVS